MEVQCVTKTLQHKACLFSRGFGVSHCYPLCYSECIITRAPTCAAGVGRLFPPEAQIGPQQRASRALPAT